MKQFNDFSIDAALVRRQAEKILQDKRRITPLPTTVADLQQRVTELELQRIEADVKRKQLQHQHRNYFEYQATLLHSVGQAVIAVDMNGVITFWNTAAEKLYGWSKEEILGRNIIGTIAFEPSKEQSTEIVTYLTSGESWSGENVVKHRNGSAIPIHVFINPVLDESGTLIGIIGVSHDISERKQYEEHLFRINQVLSNFQDAIQQVSIVSKTDKRGVITYFNDKFVEISGYTSSELIGQKHNIINSGYHPKQFWVEMWKTIASGKQWRGEIKNKAKDGSYYWVDTFIIPLLNDCGDVHEFLSIRNEITKHKAAEEHIRQSEANLRAIMDSSIQAFWLTDGELRIQAFNRITEQMVKSLLGRKIFIGETILNYVLPEQRERFIASAEKALTGEAVIYEESFTMESGEEQWSELMYLPTYNADGAIIGLTLSSFNITERKLAYRELERWNTSLEERVAKRTQELVLANKEKDEFLGIAAHDLKNPLAGILSSAEILERYFVEDSTKHFTKMIISASNQMLEIITNLLDVNRIETGMLNLYFEPVNLEILDRVVEEYQSRAAEKGIILHYEAPQRDTAWVHGDKLSLRQIFDNLVSNAVKYSLQWKNVWIRVRNGTAENTGTIRVEIQDEGPGFTEDDKKKLFGKFVRLSAQPTGGEHSTGLGLSIVKKLVEMHQGKIWCESEADKGIPGTTFIVELPMAEIITQ